MIRQKKLHQIVQAALDQQRSQLLSLVHEQTHAQIAALQQEVRSLQNNTNMERLPLLHDSIESSERIYAQQKHLRDELSSLTALFEQALSDQKAHMLTFEQALSDHKAHMLTFEQALSDQKARLNSLEQSLEQSFERCSQDIHDISQSILAITQRMNDAYKVDWMNTFGQDNLIANLQMSLVEQHVPGNRDRLSKLRNTHVGERCFVIGNGPSLCAADLTAIHEANLFSFASKRITAIYEQTSWRPDVWAASDLTFIEDHYQEIDEVSGCLKLLPCQTLINLNLLPRDTIYYPFIQIERTPAWFNQDILRGVHFYGSITCKMINIAVYMGFKEIYLLGVDHSWPIHRDENGAAIYDQSAPAHFSSQYRTAEERKKDQDNAEELMHVVDVIDRSLKDIKFFCDQLGVRVVNATRGGKLETFERQDMDLLLKSLCK